MFCSIILSIMKILVKNFGMTLTSRQMGREALAALQPLLASISPDEHIEIDFEGVNTFSPSWGDEFLTPLFLEYSNRLTLTHTQNPSVQTTIRFLEEVNKMNFTSLT